MKIMVTGPETTRFECARCMKVIKGAVQDVVTRSIAHVKDEHDGRIQ